MKILVTGGAGYIGSTICSAALDAGIEPVILDNFSTGLREFTGGRICYEGDIADARLLDRIFRDHPDIAVVIHCAALIVVPESMSDPARYYRENVAKTLEFVDGLIRNHCQRLIFSSSASIYASTGEMAVDEGSRLGPMSPYAKSKAVVELMLADLVQAYNLRVVSLRYFNPIGADPAMRTGMQNPDPTHVLGRLTQAHRMHGPFALTGVDWPTRDGSGIRDYVHVWDLARAHVAAAQRFDDVASRDGHRYEAINIGTGTGTTVRELIATFDAVVGESTEVAVADRRAGDSAGAYTITAKATRLLGWRPLLSVADGIRHALEWDRRRQRTLRKLASAA